MATLEPLILDLLEWLAAGPRPYREVMDAWRSSCPRLTIWEDSIDAGYIARVRGAHEQLICLTPVGRCFLEANRRTPALARDALPAH